MKYLLIYLAIAGVFNPLILFHVDFVGRKLSLTDYIKYGLFLNLFGFIAVPLMTAYYNYRVSKALAGPKNKQHPADAEEAEMQLTTTTTATTDKKKSFTQPGNTTLH